MRNLTWRDAVYMTPFRKTERARDSRGKPMSTGDLAALPKEISLDRLVAACKARGYDIHDVVAEALEPAMRADKSSGMNMRQQAKMAWDIIDKAEPSQRSVEHKGEVKQEVRLIIEG